jgi:hypothetical protein
MSAIVPHRREPFFVCDLLSEKLQSIAILARDIPGRHGKAIHPGSVGRWARVGVGGVRLEVVYVGGQLCSSKEAITRFIERATAARSGARGPAPQPARTARQRRRSSERDAKALKAMGA